MTQFKPKYKIGDRLRYKRSAYIIDTLCHGNSDILNEIFIINDVCHTTSNNYFYYDVKISGPNNDRFVDCRLLEENTESLQEIRKEKLNRINNIYQNESTTIL
jgi:hypothetical protein